MAIRLNQIFGLIAVSSAPSLFSGIQTDIARAPFARHLSHLAADDFNPALV